MKIGERIRKRRNDLGIGVEELAGKAGLKASTLYDLERGDSHTSTRLHHIAEALGVDVYWLETGRGEMVREPLQDYERLRDISVVGFAQGGAEDGYFEQLSEAPESVVSFNTRDERAYAIIVRGDSMSPRIRSGEIIVVTPAKEPHPGDDVIVATKDGRKMVKHYLYRRGGVVALGSINEDHPIVTLGANDIVAIEYIAGRLPPTAARELMISAPATKKKRADEGG